MPQILKKGNQKRLPLQFSFYRMKKFFQDFKTKEIYPFNSENEQKWLNFEVNWSLVYLF